MILDKNTTKVVIIAATVIILTIITIVVIAKFGKKIQSSIHNKKLLSALEAETDPAKVTLTETQINNIVTKLKSGFYSGWWGMTEDEDAIYDAYKQLNTRSDLTQVETVFGTVKEKTLAEHITRLLDQSEIAHINNILASKGINYQY